jgi:Rrf2 family transcriptional regulator, cysteine metabolism repressor
VTLLTRKVDYALLILSYLHLRSEGASAREIAAGFVGLSRSFAANILKELCQQGFVASHRGAKGGYVLQRPAEDISLLELMDSLDDSVHVAECNKTTEHDFCSLLAVCPMKNAIGVVHQRVRDVLSNVTVAELFPSGANSDGVQFGLELLPLERQLATP